MKFMIRSRIWQPLVVVLIAAAVLAGCSPSVKVRSDSDPGVDLRKYQTFGFFNQLGVEGDGYANLLGQHFRESVAREMTSRGFTQANSPQLQVNVSIGSEEKIRVNTYSDPYLYGGYYGRYGGFYGGPYGGYGYGRTQTTVRQYTEANVYIDLVDSTEHKMVWQGVATFTVTDKMQEQMRETIYSTVSEIFNAFPIPAAGATN